MLTAIISAFGHAWRNQDELKNHCKAYLCRDLRNLSALAGLNHWNTQPLNQGGGMDIAFIIT